MGNTSTLINFPTWRRVSFFTGLQKFFTYAGMTPLQRWEWLVASVKDESQYGLHRSSKKGYADYLRRKHLSVVQPVVQRRQNDPDHWD